MTATYARISGTALLPGDIPVHFDIRALPVAAANPKAAAVDYLTGATGEEASVTSVYQTRDTYSHTGPRTVTVNLSYEMKGTPVEYEIAPPYCGQGIRDYYGGHESFAKAVVLDAYGYETAVCGLHEKMYSRRVAKGSKYTIRPLERVEWPTFRDSGKRRV